MAFTYHCVYPPIANVICRQRPEAAPLYSRGSLSDLVSISVTISCPDGEGACNGLRLSAYPPISGDTLMADQRFVADS